MLTAITERYFADGGHVADFTNKAFESLDLIGWEHAPAILPSVVDQIVSACGSEESNAWRSQPIWRRCAKLHSPSCRSSWPKARQSAEVGELTKN
jgi:hypothetical protein